MPESAEFFVRVICRAESIRVSALRMAKYSNSSMDYFMEMPIREFQAWVETVNAEIEREQEAIKKQKP